MRGLPNDSIAQKGNISLWSSQTVSSGCCQCKQYPYLASFQVTWLTGENRNRKKRVCPCRGSKCHWKARGPSCLCLQLWPSLLGATQLLLGQQVAISMHSGPTGLGMKATSSVNPPANQLQGARGHRSLYVVYPEYEVAALPKVIATGISPRKLPGRWPEGHNRPLWWFVSPTASALQSKEKMSHEGRLPGPNSHLEVGNMKISI